MNGIFGMRIVLIGLGVLLGIALLANGNVVIGVLILAMAGVRIAVVVKMRERRRAFEQRREAFRKRRGERFSP